MGRLLVAGSVAMWLMAGGTAAQLPAYAELLRGLDASQPESITRARDAAIARYAAADAQSADAVFRQFWNFCNRSVSTIPPSVLKQLNWGSPVAELLRIACRDHVLRCSGRDVDDLLASKAPDAVRRRAEKKEGVALLTRYRAAGIAFSYEEGNWYPILDPQFVLDAAAKLPLGELREWVQFWAVESRQPVEYDAGLVVTWDALRERLARWEAFARAHPSLPEARDEVVPHVRQLVCLYVFGTDNSRAYDERFGGTSGRMHVDPKLLESYRRFVVLNEGSDYASLIRGIIDRLNRHEGAPSEELRAFISEQLRDPAFKDCLRGRHLLRPPVAPEVSEAGWLPANCSGLTDADHRRGSQPHRSVDARRSGRPEVSRNRKQGP